MCAHKSLHDLYQELAARQRRRKRVWTVVGTLVVLTFWALFLVAVFPPS